MSSSRLWMGVAAVIGALGVAATSAGGCAAGGDAQATGSGAGNNVGGGGGAGGGGGGGPVQCDDEGDCGALDGPCAEGACVDGLCQPQPINEFGACNDGQYCTENDVCQNGECVGGTERFCQSMGECEIGYCEEESDACVSVPGNDGGQCDDANSCTGFGTCSNGTCQQGSPINCSVYNSQCTVGACDPQVGCYPMPINEGSSCDDGQDDPCNVGQCQAGVCAQVPANDGTSCNDSQFCTVGEVCASGQCGGGSPRPCAPPSGCWIGSCDEALDLCSSVPGNDGATCDDLSPCTEGTTCSNGTCGGGVPANDGAACDDGAACTTGEICSAGACGGGSGPTVYFADDFSDSGAGWLLGPEWEIGPAQASVGGEFGADPGLDHSPSSDNGVAGVVIGGNASTNLHTYHYLESPPFDTSGAAGQVILGFRRWLNTHNHPYMHDTIEVWNGSQWITLWTSPPFNIINDTSWTYIQHNVTAYKNAAMRVRFGFEVSSFGAFVVGSWNIDDVLVASGGCP